MSWTLVFLGVSVGLNLLLGAGLLVTLHLLGETVDEAARLERAGLPELVEDLSSHKKLWYWKGEYFVTSLGWSSPLEGEPETMAFYAEPSGEYSYREVPFTNEGGHDHEAVARNVKEKIEKHEYYM